MEVDMLLEKENKQTINKDSQINAFVVEERKCHLQFQCENIVDRIIFCPKQNAI